MRGNGYLCKNCTLLSLLLKIRFIIPLSDNFAALYALIIINLAKNKQTQWIKKII